MKSLEPSALLPLLLMLAASCSAADPHEPALEFGGDEAPAPPSYRYGSWSDQPPAAPDALGLEADLHGRYLAAPDRALLRVQVHVGGEGRLGAAARVRDAATQVAAALDEGACDAELVDLAPLRRHDEAWRGAATLRYDVSFEGLTTALARFERLERCMARFDGVGAPAGVTEIAVSAPRITVDAPDAHRDALLQRLVQDRRPVAALADGGLAPALRRCESSGEVVVGHRSLRGVALALDLRCSPSP